MAPRVSLSATSDRTTTPAISTLMQMALANPSLISLAAGFVDRETLPVTAVAREVARLTGAVEEGPRALQYGTTVGDVSLRERILELIEDSEQVARGRFSGLLPRTIVTTGSQQLLYLVTEALIDPGDIVLVESPTYFVFLGVLESAGARVIGVETDERGLKLEALDAALRQLESEGQVSRVKLIYTVSEHSNPSGISLAPERREALVKLAEEWSDVSGRRIFILEDSAYRGLTYEGKEPPGVWRYDPEGETVILARTFSKTFSPGLKTGYGVLPAALVGPVLRLKGNHDFGSSNFNQVLLDRLIADGRYRDQVKLLTARYRSKRDVFLEALEDNLGSVEGVSWTRPVGGIYVWLTLPEGIDAGLAGPLFQQCLERGVVYVPGSFAFAPEPGPVPVNHARLCFGVPEPEELAEGARRLASALLDVLASREKSESHHLVAGT